MRVLVTMRDCALRDAFICEGAKKLLCENFDVEFNTTGRDYDEKALSKKLDEGFDILLTGWGTACVVGLENKITLLAHTGGSVGDLVNFSSYDAGLRVISANRIYARSTAEGVLSYILSALRKIPDMTAKMRERGFWKTATVPATRSLTGKKVGLVGVGSVAENLINLLRPFGVELYLYDPRGVRPEIMSLPGTQEAGIDEIFSTCDVISLHAALNENTYHMIGGRELSLIKPGALFVNTSRGAIVDEKALCESLKEGRFFAFLDVFEREPLEDDSPLRTLDNVYLTPHVAGPSGDLYPYIGEEIVRDMIRFKNGEPLEYEIKKDEAVLMTRHGVK